MLETSSEKDACYIKYIITKNHRTQSMWNLFCAQFEYEYERTNAPDLKKLKWIQRLVFKFLRNKQKTSRLGFLMF